MILPCYFCKQLCPMDGEIQDARNYRCDSCQVYHRQWFIDGEWKLAYLFHNFTYKEKDFHFYLYFEPYFPGSIRSELCSGADVGVKLIRLPFIADWSPANIQRKMPTLLTFM